MHFSYGTYSYWYFHFLALFTANPYIQLTFHCYTAILNFFFFLKQRCNKNIQEFKYWHCLLINQYWVIWAPKHFELQGGGGGNNIYINI